MSEIRIPDWYAEWRLETLQVLASKQAILETDYKIDVLGYGCDLEAGSLTLRDATTHLVADIQVIGSIGPENWLWAWDNPNLPANCVKDLQAVKAFGDANGIEFLSEPSWRDEDLNLLGWTMSAQAVHVLQALGVYRIDIENGALFVLIKSIRNVS